MHLQTIEAYPFTLKKWLANFVASKFLASADSAELANIAFSRKNMDFWGRHGMSASTVESLTLAGMNSIKISPRNRADTNGFVMLYCHGGGYVLGSTNSHKALVSHIVQAVGIAAYIFDYRLAPEHVYPAQIVDGVAAFNALLAMGYSADKIILIGDSAGGAMVLDMLLALKQQNQAMPVCAVAMCPWADYLSQYPSAVEHDKKAVILPTKSLALFAHHAFNGDKQLMQKHNLVSQDYNQVAPLLVQVGGHDTLCDAGVALVENLRQTDNAGACQIWQQMPHVWHALYGFYPEAKLAINAIATFINQHTQPTSTH